MKKDEIESLKSSLNNKANEKIVSLQGDVEAYKLSGEQMGDEIKALKRQLGGLKTSNANYRKQVEQLNVQVEHYKGLEIAECKELQKQLDMANLTIGELRGQIASYNNQILEYKDRIASLQEENNGLYDAIEYEQKPWWKKIF